LLRRFQPVGAVKLPLTIKRLGTLDESSLAALLEVLQAMFSP